jgi:hypothetical protein
MQSELEGKDRPTSHHHTGALTMTTMKKYVLLPEDEHNESDIKKGNGKRKLIILTSAGVAAIIGLGATNIIGALNASAADAAHHREMVAMRATYERQIHQIKTTDALLLTNTTDQLKTQEHNALRAMKIADRKAAHQAANAAYSSGHSSGYTSGYGAGNSAGYSAGNSAGYSSGYSNGNADGYNQGYNNGAASAPVQQCSNDPNVTWLPYCS